jgi:hypothetical protein
MRNSVTRLALPLAAVALIVAFGSIPTDAHKGITSKYTYNDDVYPILKAKCGNCHADNGPTPMSLLTYNDGGGAVAWAQSIREMLIAEAMPPWHADPTGPAVKNMHTLTPREMDILLTWSAGGTPQGDLHKKPGPSQAVSQWSLGKPDATIALDEYTLAQGTMEATNEVTVDTKFTEAKWVKAVDLLPGTPSIVRQATIAIEGGQTLAVWQPAHDAVTAPGGTAFKIPAAAKLTVKIRYKKGWQDEQTSKGDKSTIGLYFTDEPLSGKAIEAVVINPPAGEAPPTFGSTLDVGGRVLAIRPQVDHPYATVDISATVPSGRKVALLKLRGIRPEWPRRYWLADPVELPKGTKIEVTTTPADTDTGPLGPPIQSPMQIGIDLVAQ